MTFDAAFLIYIIDIDYIILYYIPDCIICTILFFLNLKKLVVLLCFHLKVNDVANLNYTNIIIPLFIRSFQKTPYYLTLIRTE